MRDRVAVVKVDVSFTDAELIEVEDKKQTLLWEDPTSTTEEGMVIPSFFIDQNGEVTEDESEAVEPHDNYITQQVFLMAGSYFIGEPHATQVFIHVIRQKGNRKAVGLAAHDRQLSKYAL